MEYKSSEQKRQYNKEYKLTHKEYYREYNKEYLERNKEELYSKNKEWRLNNKEWIKEYQREYREHHRERIREMSNAYYHRTKNNPGKKEMAHAYRIKTVYNLNRDDFKALLEKQQNKCAICKQPFTKTPDVDHDHVTDRVRGLLHNKCNLILANANDDPKILRNAIKYLKQYTSAEQLIEQTST